MPPPDRRLHAVIVISNPIRFKSRYRLHKEFVQRVKKQKNFHLTVVELAFGNRPFEVTDSDDPDHVQVRSVDELWFKENLVNLGVERLTENYPRWNYMAWIDADIEFYNSNWVDECVHSLQHYHFVQMWEDAVDFGPDNQIIATHKSFMSQYIKGAGQIPPTYHTWHPGYGWSCTREGYDAVGGMIDFSILGAGDRAMALGLIGKIESACPKGMTGEYKQGLLAWQQRAQHFIKADVGYVSGSIFHHWHGKKKDRQYADRWKILTKNKFNPITDLKKDSYGLWQLNTISPRQIKLRDDIRSYFRARQEDSTDVV